MPKRKLKFVRTGTFSMIGEVEVDLDDYNDVEEAINKADNKEFVSYLPVDIEYDEEVWTFDAEND